MKFELPYERERVQSAARSKRYRFTNASQALPETRDIDRALSVAWRGALKKRRVRSLEDIPDGSFAQEVLGRLLRALAAERFDVDNRETRDRVQRRLGLLDHR